MIRHCCSVLYPYLLYLFNIYYLESEMVTPIVLVTGISAHLPCGSSLGPPVHPEQALGTLPALGALGFLNFDIDTVNVHEDTFNKLSMLCL